MQTRTYALKGKEVLPQYAGKPLTFRVAETADDVAKLSADQESAIELAASAFDVWLQGRVRAMAATKNKDGSPKYTLDEIQNFANTAVYQIRGEGSPAKPKTAKAKVQAASKNAGNKLFEACLADETKLSRLVKMDVVDIDEFNAWKAAREEAAQTPAPAVATA